MGTIPARQAARLMARCNSLLASFAVAMLFVQHASRRPGRDQSD
jgi:hypothetical protein